jgi:hypothetical protein
VCVRDVAQGGPEPGDVVLGDCGMDRRGPVVVDSRRDRCDSDEDFGNKTRRGQQAFRGALSTGQLVTLIPAGEESTSQVRIPARRELVMTIDGRSDTAAVVAGPESSGRRFSRTSPRSSA